jgi:hypothetical protein
VGVPVDAATVRQHAWAGVVKVGEARTDAPYVLDREVDAFVESLPPAAGGCPTRAPRVPSDGGEAKRRISDPTDAGPGVKQVQFPLAASSPSVRYRSRVSCQAAMTAPSGLPAWSSSRAGREPWLCGEVWS